MSRFKIVLDPGHGGLDGGAVLPGARRESDSNLEAALHAAIMLRDAGHDVLLTREDDRYVSLAERARLANDWGADLFLSLHADWAPGGNPKPHGHHCVRSIVAKSGQGGDRLAHLLVYALTEATHMAAFARSGGPVWSERHPVFRWADRLAVIRWTTMPAVLVERGFMSNPDDCALLFDEEHLRQQAGGIVLAVDRYFEMVRS